MNRRVLGWPRISFCGNHDDTFTLSLTETLDVPVKLRVNAGRLKCGLYWILIGRFVSRVGLCHELTNESNAMNCLSFKIILTLI